MFAVFQKSFLTCGFAKNAVIAINAADESAHKRHTRIQQRESLESAFYPVVHGLEQQREQKADDDGNHNRGRIKIERPFRKFQLFGQKPKQQHRADKSQRNAETISVYGQSTDFKQYFVHTFIITQRRPFVNKVKKGCRRLSD